MNLFAISNAVLVMVWN